MTGGLDILVFGTAGHAREVAEIAELCRFRPIMVARDLSEASAYPGAEEVVLDAEVQTMACRRYAIAVGDPALRRRIFGDCRVDAEYPTLIHPDSSIARSSREAVSQSVGSVVFAGARLSIDLQFGNFVVVNQNATIAHECEIGDFVTISPGAHLSGLVSVGDGSWIGSGAVVNQGRPGAMLAIGSNSMVGSGAVVLSDCQANATYVGVPAVRIK